MADDVVTDLARQRDPAREELRRLVDRILAPERQSAEAELAALQAMAREVRTRQAIRSEAALPRQQGDR